MDCPACQHHVTAGSEIVIDPLRTEWSHCPYCLAVLSPGFNATDSESQSLAAERAERRAEVRARFVSRLRDTSSDGTLHCPVCEHPLDETAGALPTAEHLRCRLCCHDLAALAYREDAYGAQRWLPVVGALADLQSDSQWMESKYIGAVARACQMAFSNMATYEAKPHALLTNVLRRNEWQQSDPEDWTSNIAVQQYRRTAGAGLLLL